MPFIFIDGQRLVAKAEEVNDGKTGEINKGEKEESRKSESYSVNHLENTLAYTLLPESDKELFEFFSFVSKDGFGKFEHLELSNLDFTGREDSFKELIIRIFTAPSLHSLIIRNCKPMSIFLNKAFTELSSSKLNDLRIQFGEDCTQEEMDCIKAIVAAPSNLHTFLVGFYYESRENFIKAKKVSLDSIITALTEKKNKNLIRFELAPIYRQNTISGYLKNNHKATNANVQLQPSPEEKPAEINADLIQTIVAQGNKLLDTDPDITVQRFYEWITMQLHMVAPVLDPLEYHQIGVKRTNDALKIFVVDRKHKFFKDLEESYYLGLTSRIEFEKYPFQQVLNIHFNKDIADSQIAFNFDVDKKLHNVRFRFPKIIDTNKILTADKIADCFKVVKIVVKKNNAQIKQYLDILGRLLWAISQASPNIDGNAQAVQIFAEIFFQRNGWQFSEKHLIYPHALVEFCQGQFSRHFVEEYCALYQQVSSKQCSEVNLKLSEEISKLIYALRPYSSGKNTALYQQSSRYLRVNVEGEQSTLILLETKYKDASFAASASRLTSFFASKVTAFFNAELRSLIDETITVLREIMLEFGTDLQTPAKLISDLIGTMESTIYYYGKLSGLNKNANCEQILLLALNNLYNIDFNTVYPDLVPKKQKVKELKLAPTKLNTGPVDYRSEDEQSLASIHNSIQDYSDLNKADSDSDDDYFYVDADSDDESLAGKVSFSS